MIKITVDNREIKAIEGTPLLQACLDNGIYIPNLCFIRGMESPHSSCRMCFVEIEGKDKPVTSCTVTVRESMVVKTDTPSVRRLQRSAFRLLLSVHDVDCGHCIVNKRCVLQDIAGFLKVGLKTRQLDRHLKEIVVDRSHPLIDYYPNRCVLCGKCVHTCKIDNAQTIFAFAKRGFDTVISSHGEDNVSEISRELITSCVNICPVGAITLKNSP